MLGLIHSIHPIPFEFFFLGIFIVIIVTIFRGPKMGLPETIAALNSVGSQPTAITVLIVGCMMLMECKLYGLDPTIAGGIIGVASNMLTNMFAKQHTDATGNTTTDTTIPSTPKQSDLPAPVENQIPKS